MHYRLIDRWIHKAVILLLLVTLLVAIASGCAAPELEPSDIDSIETYQDIPGITAEELAAVESIKSSRSSFTFGAIHSKEFFHGEDDEHNGYVVLLCERLTEFFGVPFAVEEYMWEDLIEGLEDGMVDFTIDLPANDEFRQNYYMTSAIALRTETAYHQHQMEGVQESDYFSQNTPIPFGISTGSPELQPIIDALQKASNAGVGQYLNELYRTGQRLYSMHQLSLLLTEEEQQYIRDNPVISMGALYNNYPVDFYNTYEEEWQGIVFDVLGEVEKFTGLTFEVSTDVDTQWSELLSLLENGDISLIPTLNRTPEREEQYLFPENPLMRLNMALITEVSYPRIETNDILFLNIGLVKDYTNTAVFQRMYPDHPGIVVFDTLDETLEALENGEIDAFASSIITALTLTNYEERFGYHTNYIFDYSYDTCIGFNNDEALLVSIIDKAFGFIDVDDIVDDWMRKVFDYQSRLMSAQRPWLIGAVVLATLVVILMAVLFQRTRHEGKKLEELVEKRTQSLVAVSHDLEKAVENAKAANRAKSNFLANMSHEMRTPLTAVIGLTELTLKTVQLDDETTSNLVKVYRSGETLLLLINDILDISKIEADRFTLNPAEYDVPSMLNDTITQSIMYIESKPVKFSLDIEENLPSTLFGDELRVKQILNNLLSNAFKFTKEGKVELRIRHEREGNDVWLTAQVSDSGIGIKPEDIGKLFTTYSRMEEEANQRSVNRRTEGTGLGLSISKKAAEMMDGTITVISEYGKGSTFTVRLRQGYVNDSVIGPAVADNLKNSHYTLNKFQNKNMTRLNLSYARVLVVDDNATNLDVARGLMSMYGMKIDCVDGGRAAIEAVRSEEVRYDAIFMDHMMPEIDGIEATRIIREEIGTDYAKNVPIIALTANAIAGNEEMFLSKGFQAFIPKPIELSALDTVVRQWVRDRDAEALLNEKNITVERRTVKRQLLSEDIPGLDIKKGIARFNYNEETYIEVLKSFAANTKPLIDGIRDFDGVGDLDEYGVTVHGIKGSCYGIFAEAAGDKALELEMAAKVADVEIIRANNPAFVKTIDRLISDIEEALEKAGLSQKLIKDFPDEALLAALLRACGSFDIDEMDAAMAEIDKWEYTDDGGLAEWLKSSLEMGRYKEIRERLLAVIGD